MNNSNSKFETVIMVKKIIDFRKLFYQQSLEFGGIERVLDIYDEDDEEDEDDETDFGTKEDWVLLIYTLPSGYGEI